MPVREEDLPSGGVSASLCLYKQNRRKREKMERLNAWNTYDLPMQDECMEFAKQYMNFLNIGKTERECVDFFVAEAEKNGYIELSRAISE